MDPSLAWSVPLLSQLIPSDLVDDRAKKYAFWTSTCLHESSDFCVLHIVAQCCYSAPHLSQAAVIKEMKKLVGDDAIWKELCEHKSRSGNTPLACYFAWSPEPYCEEVISGLRG